MNVYLRLLECLNNSNNICYAIIIVIADMLMPHIMHRDTNYGKCIAVKMRLVITMRFLATGYLKCSLLLVIL